MGRDSLRGRGLERLRPNNDDVDAAVAIAGIETDCELPAFLSRDGERLRLRLKKEVLFGDDAADTDCDEDAAAVPLTLLLPLMKRLDRGLKMDDFLLSSVRTEMSSFKLRGIAWDKL